MLKNKTLNVTTYWSNSKMANFDYITKEKSNEHNEDCPQISDHSYRILIIGGSWSGKKNSLFNLMNHQLDIHKI